MNARQSILALSLLLALNGAAMAKTWKVNLKEADISALVSEVSDITGKNFIVDPRVKGNITVISSKRFHHYASRCSRIARIISFSK